jgi:signal transduction histidine kinase
MKSGASNVSRLRLPLLAFSAGAVLIAHHAWRSYRQGLSEQANRVRVEATQTGADLSGMSQHLLRKQLPASVDLLMSYASLSPELDFGAVIAPGDNIQHATRRQWNGTSLAGSPLGNVKSLADIARQKMESKIELTDDGERLIAAFPFWSKPDGQSKGVVLLQYNLEYGKAIAIHETFHESISQAFSLAAGCLLFWLFLSQQLDLRRVFLVLEHARSLVTRGESGPDDHEDELASFTRTIHSAAERFDETEQQMNRLAAGIRDVFWYARVDGPAPPFVNAAYLDTWEEKSAAGLRTRRWSWLRKVIPEDRRRALDWLVELRAKGQAAPIELRLRFPDSRVKWIECRGFAVAGLAPGSGLRSIGGLVTDVTDRKNLDRRLLEAAEEERMRIGQDLHDDVCQRMAAAMLKGGVLHSSLSRSGLPEAALAAEVSHDLSEATEIVRGFAQGLAPVVIEAEGLATALSQICAFIDRVFGIDCQSECADLPDDLDPAATTHLYRVAQELATNAARHAQANHIMISLTIPADSRSLSLKVTNDGNPFNGKPAAPTQGMGLHAVRKHMEALGGQITFVPSKIALGGTTVICDVPLPVFSASNS